MSVEDLAVYLPIDRRRALARGATLPDRTRGAALFADISGFTPLTVAAEDGAPATADPSTGGVPAGASGIARRPPGPGLLPPGS